MGEKEEIVIKLKEIKNKLVDNIQDLKAEIKVLEKTKKPKEKENCDLNRNLVNAHDTIKNIKTEKSLLKMSKSRLETDIRKLEKTVQKKPTNLKSIEEYIPTKLISSKAVSRIITRSFPSSLVSHCIPFNSKNQLSSSSVTSMYTHCVPFSCSSANDTSKEFKTLITDIREKLRKDTANIFAEMKNKLSLLFIR